MKGDAAPAAVPAPRSEPGARTPLSKLVVATALLAAVPLVLNPIVAAREGWMPVGDVAQHEGLVRDVWNGHLPLLGTTSTLDEQSGAERDPDPENHPGPLLYWILAVPYPLFEKSDAALLPGLVLLNLVSLACIVFFASRAGGPQAALAVTALASLAVWFLGPAFPHDPWNVEAVLLPFLAFLVASWAGLLGNPPAWPAALFFGSLAFQSHTAYGAIFVAGVLLAGVGALRAYRDTRLRGANHRWLFVTAIVALFCWSGPLIEELQPGRGNLSAMLSGLLESGRKTLGPAKAVALLGTQLWPWRWWSQPHPLMWDQTPILSPLLTLGAAVTVMVLTMRAAENIALKALSVHGLVMTLAGLVTCTSAPQIAILERGVQQTSIRWLWVLGPWLTFVALLGALVQLRAAFRLNFRSVRVAAGLRICACTTVALSVVAAAYQAGIGADRDGPLYETVRSLAGQIESRVPTTGEYELKAEGTTAFLLVAPSLVPALERRGFDVSIANVEETEWGSHRKPRDPVATLLILSGPGVEKWFQEGVEVASWTPHRPADSARRNETLRRQLVEYLTSSTEQLPPAVQAFLATEDEGGLTIPIHPEIGAQPWVRELRATEPVVVWRIPAK
ncbi:MAG: hypothetical protein KatS3mg008_0543 [Acidimicrobiales bacterium]|nr:MAG: hypothetical protein KatS3mg008_0543 [Acidimicrobiales bacterium]